MKNYRVRWVLHTLFSKEGITKRIGLLQKELNLISKKQLVQNIKALEAIASRIKEIESYVDCLNVADVYDQKAKQLKALVVELTIQYEGLLLELTQNLVELPEIKFKKILSKTDCKSIAYFLESRRSFAKKLCPPEKEQLILKLTSDGFHGWNQLYNSLVSSEKITVLAKTLSFAQADNLLASPDRKVRQESFKRMQQACEKHKMLYG